MSATEFIPRLSSWLESRAVGGARCPPLATEAERITFDAGQPLARGTGLVLVSAASRVAYQGIADALASAGYSTAWHVPSKTAATGWIAAVFDARRGDAQDGLELERFSAAVCPAPLVLLLGFPRPQDAHLRDPLRTPPGVGAGPRAILAKPWRVNDLCQVLHELIQRSSGGVSSPAAPTGRRAAPAKSA